LNVFKHFALETCDLVSKEMNAYAMLSFDSTVKYLHRSRSRNWKEATAHEIRALVSEEMRRLGFFQKPTLE
jgi:hypothetical protein